MRSRSFGWLVVALAVAACWQSCPVVRADEDTSTALVSLDLKDVDVRAAIESLFRGSGRNFAVESSVTGTVPSLSIKDVPFDLALKSLARVCGLTFRIANGVYVISKKPTAAETASSQGTASPQTEPPVDDTTTRETIIDKVPLSNVGASELLAMISGNTGTNGGYGGMGGMNGTTGMYGMSGMGGMSGMSGMSGMGGMSSRMGSGYGSSYGSSYGGYGSSYGSNSGSYTGTSSWRGW